MNKTGRFILCQMLVLLVFIMTVSVCAASLKFDTDDVYEITGNNTHVSNVAVKDGVLTFSTTGTDPQLYVNKSYDVNTKTGGVVNADKVKQIEIKFASTSKEGFFELYFWSVNPEDGGYFCKPYADGDASEQSYINNRNKINYSGSGSLDDYITVTFDQSQIKYWKGMVGHLRIDTGNASGVDFKIDYIRFIGEDEEEKFEKPKLILDEEKLYGECLFYDDFESYNADDVPSAVYYSKLGTTPLTKADQCKAIKITDGISGNNTKVIELTGSSPAGAQYPFIRVAYPLSEIGQYTMIADMYSVDSGLFNWSFFNGYKKKDGTSSRIMHYAGIEKGKWVTVNVNKNTAQVADFSEFTYFGFGGEGVGLDEKLYFDNIRVYFKKLLYATVSGGDGALGTAPALTFLKNSTLTFPDNTFTKKDCKFKGWTTNVDSKLYQPGDTMETGEAVSIIVTAVWERAEPAEKTPQIIAEEKLYGECLFFDDFESYEVNDVPSSVYYSNLGETSLVKADQCGAIKIAQGIGDNDTKVIELTGNGTVYYYPFIRVLYPLSGRGKYTMLADMYTEAGEVINFCFFNGFTANSNLANKRIMYYPSAVKNEWTALQTDYKTGDISEFVTMNYFGFGAEGVKNGETLYIDNIRLYFEEAEFANFVAGEGTVGEAPELEYYINETILLPYNTFEKEGYVFAGWKSSSDGKIYKEREKLTLGKVDNLTLTAVWSRFIPKLVRKNSIRTQGVQGIRFAGYVADEEKPYATEIGFIITTADMLGDYELKFGDTKENGVGISPDGVKFVYGAAYDKLAGKDIIYATDGSVFGASVWKDVQGTFFTGVLTHVPEWEYFTKFVVRPYALIDGEYVYGDTLVRSVRDIAEIAYNNGNREDYVMKIVEKTGIVGGRRVCFLGDSITQNGTFIKELAQLYLDSETEKGRYEFYNCGIPGDTASGALRRVQEDVIAYDPDIVFIMFGMNDIGQENYIKANYSEKTEEYRQSSLKYYRENMVSVIEILLENDIEVILCTPTPYDDITNKVYDCNAGLEKCAETVRELAQVYNLELVDHYKNMYDLRGTKYWGANDPIHPNALGHHVMAQSIMYDLGYIDEMDVTTAITDYDVLNDERHTKSYNFRMFVMVERTMLRSGYTTTEAKLSRAKELQAKETSDHWIWIYQNYIDNCGKGAQMLDEVIRITEEMSYKD